MPPPIRNITPSPLHAIPRGAIVIAVWAILALIFLWTGAYTVPIDSVGVVQRFGRYHETVGNRLQFKTPYGVDVVQVVRTRRQLKMEFGFRDTEGTSRYEESQ